MRARCYSLSAAGPHLSTKLRMHRTVMRKHMKYPYTILVKMKRLFSLLCIFFLTLLTNKVNAQEEYQLGSNDGQYISIFGTKLYYEEYGQGPPILLLHGGLSSMWYYRFVVPYLSNHFKVITVDSPGHGRSYHSDTLSYQLLADHFSEMIDLMDLDSVFILGCSDGAIVAMKLAFDRPDKVKRIISDGGLSKLSSYTSIGKDWLNEFEPSTRSKSWVDWYQELNPQGNQWIKFLSDAKVMWSEEVYISDDELAQIKCPTLIIMGDKDYFIPVEHGVEIHRAISGSQLCILPDIGHAVCNKKPEIVNEILLDFLNQQ